MEASDVPTGGVRTSITSTILSSTARFVPTRGGKCGRGDVWIGVWGDTRAKQSSCPGTIPALVYTAAAVGVASGRASLKPTAVIQLCGEAATLGNDDAAACSLLPTAGLGGVDSDATPAAVGAAAVAFDALGADASAAAVRAVATAAAAAAVDTAVLPVAPVAAAAAAFTALP